MIHSIVRLRPNLKQVHETITLRTACKQTPMRNKSSRIFLQAEKGDFLEVTVRGSTGFCSHGYRAGCLTGQSLERRAWIRYRRQGRASRQFVVLVITHMVTPGMISSSSCQPPLISNNAYWSCPGSCSTNSRKCVAPIIMKLSLILNTFIFLRQF